MVARPFVICSRCFHITFQWTSRSRLYTCFFTCPFSWEIADSSFFWHCADSVCAVFFTFDREGSLSRFWAFFRRDFRGLEKDSGQISSKPELWWWLPTTISEKCFGQQERKKQKEKKRPFSFSIADDNNMSICVQRSHGIRNERLKLTSIWKKLQSHGGAPSSFVPAAYISLWMNESESPIHLLHHSFQERQPHPSLLDKTLLWIIRFKYPFAELVARILVWSEKWVRWPGFLSLTRQSPLSHWHSPVLVRCLRVERRVAASSEMWLVHKAKKVLAEGFRKKGLRGLEKYMAARLRHFVSATYTSLLNKRESESCGDEIPVRSSPVRLFTCSSTLFYHSKNVSPLESPREKSKNQYPFGELVTQSCLI